MEKIVSWGDTRSYLHIGLRVLCAQRGWEVKGGRVVFNGSMEAGAGAAEVPAVDLINHALTYARELERIV